MFKWLSGWFTPTTKKNKMYTITKYPLEHKTEHKNKSPKAAVKVITKTQMGKLSKLQLETMGRENGIELDRRKTKDKLVDQLHKKLTTKEKK
jgi:hypothetical protein